MDKALDELAELWAQALEIWRSGGWAMWAIFGVAMLIFGLGVHLQLTLAGKGFRRVPESTWRRWILHPREREGSIGALLEFVTGGRSVKQTASFFDQLRTAELAPLRRDLMVMKILVGTAPLVGLLGTVTGMLTTFDGLATGNGGDKTLGVVAGGISEALITTLTGLVVALPGVFYQYRLSRRFEDYRAFIAHVETTCVQVQHRADLRSRREKLQRAALQRIADHLQTSAQASVASSQLADHIAASVEIVQGESDPPVSAPAGAQPTLSTQSSALD